MRVMVVWPERVVVDLRRAPRQGVDLDLSEGKEEQLTICTSFRVVSSLFATSCHGFCSRNVVRIFRIVSLSGPRGSMMAEMPAIMALLNMRSCPVIAYRRKLGTSRWNSCLI